jgi:hypothetical protein
MESMTNSMDTLFAVAWLPELPLPVEEEVEEGEFEPPELVPLLVPLPLDPVDEDEDEVGGIGLLMTHPFSVPWKLMSKKTEEYG